MGHDQTSSVQEFGRFWPSSIIVFVQEAKVYVQHRVRDNGELLWDLIANKNACFYIAGWVWGLEAAADNLPHWNSGCRV